MRRILPQLFFDRSTVTVARELLGKFLVTKIGMKEIAHMITEVEIYDGFRDRGSHAHRGKTLRNAPMFGSAGHWYVYFTYGVHWMLNIVTQKEHYPAAVLIRGVQEIAGPGRVTKQLSIDGTFSGKKAERATGLWLEDRGMKIPEEKVLYGPRVGIDYAGVYWKRRKWRFSTRV